MHTFSFIIYLDTIIFVFSARMSTHVACRGGGGKRRRRKRRKDGCKVGREEWKEKIARRKNRKQCGRTRRGK